MRKERLEDTRLLALKMEEEAVSQGMPERSFPRAFRKECSHDFNLVK